MGYFNQETSSRHTLYVWALSGCTCKAGQCFPKRCTHLTGWPQDHRPVLLLLSHEDFALCGLMKDIWAWDLGEHKGHISDQL